jgi:hypothetical protein
MNARSVLSRPTADTNSGRLRSFALVYLFFVGPQALIHLLIGSSLGCVLLWSACMAIGFALVYHGGLHNTLVWLGLMFVARYVGLASLLKIGLGKTLDSPLHTPFETYLITFVAIAELYLAYRLVSCLPVKRAVFKNYQDPTYLNMFSIITFIVGSLAFFLINLKAAEDLELGGFRIFMECILLMGIVSRTAYVLRKSQQRRNMDFLLGLMLPCAFLFSVVCNQKSTAIGAVLAYLLTVVGMRRSLPWSVVVPVVICMWVVAAFLAPLIFHLRTLNANNKTLTERVVDIGDYLRYGSMNESRELTALYYERTEEVLAYFGPLGSLSAVAQRIGLVQAADAIKRGIDANGYLGPSFLIEAVGRIVPRIFNPEKNMDNPADVICWHAGVQDKRIVNRQSIGIVSGCYAVGGWTGVLLIPFPLFALYLLLQRLWSDTSSANVFAVYFVVANYNKFAEFDPSSFIAALFKEIELEMIVYILLIFLTNLILAMVAEHRRSPRGVPHRANARVRPG